MKKHQRHLDDRAAGTGGASVSACRVDEVRAPDVPLGLFAFEAHEPEETDLTPAFRNLGWHSVASGDVNRLHFSRTVVNFPINVGRPPGRRRCPGFA